MKTIRKSGLTHSWKTRLTARHTRLDVIDALNEHCEYLDTFVGWFKAIGEMPQGDPLERTLIGSTGALIGREVTQVRLLVAQLAKELNR